MPDNSWRARARIHGAALRHNLGEVRRHAPGCQVMAVLKADAYGHGMERVAAALAAHVDGFAVATMEEALRCRTAHPTRPITLLGGLPDSAALDACHAHGLAPVLHTPAHVAWAARYRGAPLTMWLKIDTGMNRLGLTPAEVEDAVARLQGAAGVEELRLMSHLANADDPADGYTPTQLARFRRCTDRYPLARSLANSAAVLGWPPTHLDWVRPGIMLYGASPFADSAHVAHRLRPVMHLEARLLAVKPLAAGQPVGYGGAYKAAAAMRMGVVGFGYGDGYPRSIRPPAYIRIGAARAPLIGRVAMDMITVDVTHCPAAAGDPVVLWGDDPSVNQVAAWSDTIPHELLCKVTSRIPRIAVEQPPPHGDHDGEI